MKALRGALAFGFAASLAASARAAPGHSYGFGSRATALAGAVAAGGADAGALFYNPALLALAPSSQVLLGYRGVTSALETNHEDAGIAGLATLDAAALGRGSFLGLPVGFGLGLSLSNGHLSRLETLREDEPHWVLRETLPELVDLAASLSLRPLPWLSLGAGSGFLATTRGGFLVQGTALLSDGAGAEYDSRLRHSVDAELVSVRYWLLGAAISLPERRARTGRGLAWRLGAYFRDEARLEQSLRGTLDGTVDAGLLQVPVRYEFETQSLVAFQPRQLVLAVQARSGALRLELDLSWEQWSRYPSPFSRTGTHLEADVPPGVPLDLPPDSLPQPPSAAGLEDSVRARAGVEYGWPLSASASLALRGGYAYLPSPVPRGSDAGRLLDADEHVFSLGAGVMLDAAARYLPQRVSFDAHALFGHLPNRRQTRGDAIFYAKGHSLGAGASLGLAF